MSEMKKGWEMKKLGDMGKVSMCKRVLKEQTTFIGDIPFYKIGTFSKEPDAFISKEIHDEFLKKYPFSTDYYAHILEIRFSSITLCLLLGAH